MRVLIADDDEDILLALELLLHRGSISTLVARSPEEVLLALGRQSDEQRIDALLLDLNYERDTTSGQEGYSLLAALREKYPRVPAVVMTGWASIEGAVEAMRCGAVDYLPKPWKNAQLLELLRGLESSSKTEPGAKSNIASACSSAAMQQIHSVIEQVAFSEVPVLITGEHGTGKELVARQLHTKSGRKGRFVALNAGALAEGTFESELFGHVRGAFTDAKSAREGAFARAEEGTLFLDEVGTMPLVQQAKLLRVLQQRQFIPLGASVPFTSSARIVSATNADLPAMVRDGRFREDLLYRLNTIVVAVPPLRERPEEIEGLVAQFVQREAGRYGFAEPQLDEQVLPTLLAHRWPGNIRELEHTVQRAVLLSARGGRLTREHLGLEGALAGVPAIVPAGGSASTLKDTERAAIEQALKLHPEDRQAAAQSLGLSRSAFYRRLSQYGIKPWK